MNLPGTDLTPDDLNKLVRCAISPELARQANLRRVNRTEGGELIGRNGAADYSGIAFPYFWPERAGPREYRLRLDHPELEYKDGRLKEKNKYLSPPGRGNLLYLPPDTKPEWLVNISIPIVFVEGEKKTLAAWTLAWHGVCDASGHPRVLPIGLAGVWGFRGTIARAPGPNGSPRPVKGVIEDLSKLALEGRKVTIAFDINVSTNESVQYAHSAFTAELKRRGSQVHHFAWPADTPASVNGIDDMIAAVGPDQVLELLENAPSAETRKPGSSAFRLTDAGVYYYDPDPEKEALRICGPLDVAAFTRDANSDGWGRLLQWCDSEGRSHEWAMPMSLLAADGSEYRARLLDGGLFLAPGRKARELLTVYLQTMRPETRALCVARVGWHDGVFVLPGASIGPNGTERVLYQSPYEAEHYFRVSGTMEDWRYNVGRFCSGNSRLILVVSCSFAGLLLRLVSAESGGIHLRGATSTGKTTALVVGGSALGGGGRSGFVQSWRATANGLEAIAEMHNDLTLFLDEIGQMDAREAAETAYLLGNGSGKARMSRNIGARKKLSWSLLFVSAGEITLADHSRTAGKRTKGGAEIRLISVEADAGEGMGLFENIHGAESPDAFARQLTDAARRFYGAPLRTYLEFLAKNRTDTEKAIRNFQTDFVARHVPENASGEVFRAAQRFGLIAAAGELATDIGITGWEPEEATDAAARCLKSWIADRGTTGGADAEAAVNQVRQFLEAHGASRFQTIRYPDVEAGVDSPDENQLVVNRAGFRQKTPDGKTEFLIFREVFKAEVCQGFDYRMVARALLERKFLDRQSPALTKLVRLPGNLGTIRAFSVGSSILEE